MPDVSPLEGLIRPLVRRAEARIDAMSARDVAPKMVQDTVAFSARAARAVEAADRLFHYEQPPRPSGDLYRRVERDAFDVNASDLARKQADFGAAVAASSDLEEQALNRLAEPSRAQYRNLAALTADRPSARLALQTLLFDGHLTDGRLSHEGLTLLGALDAVARQPLVQGVDRPTMVGDLIHETAFPGAIDQHNRGTCTVSAAQIYVARNHPAEYVRIVGGLASPEGKVTLADGEILARTPGSEQVDDSNRTASSRLWQSSMMTFADPANPYVFATDRRQNGAYGTVETGIKKLYEGVVNARDIFHDRNNGATPEDLLDVVDRHTRLGRDVPISANWGKRNADGTYEGGHDLITTGVQDGRVYYENPWGQQESMPIADFAQRATATHVILRTAIAPGQVDGDPFALASQIANDVATHPTMPNVTDSRADYTPLKNALAEIADLGGRLQVKDDPAAQAMVKAADRGSQDASAQWDDRLAARQEAVSAVQAILAARQSGASGVALARQAATTLARQALEHPMIDGKQNYEPLQAALDQISALLTPYQASDRASWFAFKIANEARADGASDWENRFCRRLSAARAVAYLLGTEPAAGQTVDLTAMKALAADAQANPTWTNSATGKTWNSPAHYDLAHLQTIAEQNADPALKAELLKWTQWAQNAHSDYETHTQDLARASSSLSQLLGSKG